MPIRRCSLLFSLIHPTYSSAHTRTSFLSPTHTHTLQPLDMCRSVPDSSAADSLNGVSWPLLSLLTRARQKGNAFLHSERHTNSHTYSHFTPPWPWPLQHLLKRSREKSPPQLQSHKLLKEGERSQVGKTKAFLRIGIAPGLPMKYHYSLDFAKVARVQNQ